MIRGAFSVEEKQDCEEDPLIYLDYLRSDSASK
jgi:hypothetical protein